MSFMDKLFGKKPKEEPKKPPPSKGYDAEIAKVGRRAFALAALKMTEKDYVAFLSYMKAKKGDKETPLKTNANPLLEEYKALGPAQLLKRMRSIAQQADADSLPNIEKMLALLNTLRSKLKSNEKKKDDK